MANQLQGKIEKLKSTITKYENDLITLKARARTAASTRRSTSSLPRSTPPARSPCWKRCGIKLKKDESLAQATTVRVADIDKSVDNEIDAALSQGNTTANDSLAALKAKMGMRRAVSF